ncbi:methyltransferase domain-containing protein [Eubacteriales bacterium OttesenSCG-928-N14]|nr:methyltransferase domain-containing protein [Eubacteriales bacterium OttesenSCG-928-N14]
MSAHHYYKEFAAQEALYRCPLCHTAFAVNDAGSLLCKNAHCYDISSRGYVNLLSRQMHTKYGKELFLARREVFEGGLYDEILSAVIQQMEPIAAAGSFNLLDAGCGEGFFAKRLAAAYEAAVVIALDISKDAILMASGGPPCGVQWAVADIANLPLADNSMDVIVNILSPANYTEFYRVLRPGGRLIKVAPAPLHLHQLRHAASGQIQSTGPDSAQVQALFEQHLPSAAVFRVQYSRPMELPQLYRLAAMTPMLLDLDMASLDLHGIDGITVDVNIMVGEVVK